MVNGAFAPTDRGLHLVRTTPRQPPLNSGIIQLQVVAPPSNEYAYEEWRKSDTLRAPYKVSSALLRGLRDTGALPVECPLICFVNARSGGRKGADLALRLSQAVGRIQVFDIGDKDYRPDKVLSKIYENLKNLEAAGDPRVATVRQRLRLLVCGGDGTIAWVLGVIKKLRLQPEPPVAIMPMGTGNDLSRSFLWGPAFDNKWIRGHQGMYTTLYRVATAKDDRLDCWNITITTPRKGMFNNGFPHSLSPPQPAAGPPPVSVNPSAPYPRSAAAVAAAAAAAQAGSNYGRGQSSNLNPNTGGGGAGGATAAQLVLHASGRDPSNAGATDRSVPVSIVATHGSATPLQNIATSSVGSAATTFTTATNMSLHTGAAQAGTSVPPTIVSGAVSTAEEDETGIGVLTGMFWNYFSVGLDAKSAWGFHQLREERPGCTSSRAANQFWYSFFSCTSGWFCCAQPLNVKVTLEVLQAGPGGEAAGWQPVKLPVNVKALIVLNLQSYAGGRNLWGPRTTAADEKKHGFKPPSYNDGLLEVVGLQSGWHTGIVMAGKGQLLHASRICQAAGVRISVAAPYVRRDGEASHCYMQVDGEPWMQDIPVKGQEAPVRVEIVHAGVSRVLRNHPRVRSDNGIVTGVAKKTPRQPAPVVTAVPEAPSPAAQQPPPPAAASVPLSQSQSSIQLASPPPAPASVMGLGGPAVAVVPTNVQVQSVSGALVQQQTHGSLSGGVLSGWARTASAGRPSATSAAGSSSAAGIEPLIVEGGGGRGGGVGGAASRAGENVADQGTPSSSGVPLPPPPPLTVAAAAAAALGAQSLSPAIDTPTPRTLSTDLGSQGARSAVTVPE